MKKTLIALLLAALMLCTITAASAAELIGSGNSLYFTEDSGMSVADFLTTPESRAYATWFGMLEFCDLFGKSYNEIDMQLDTFVTSSRRGELHVYLPTRDLSGYYDVCWLEKSGLVTLSFESKSISNLRYDSDTFINDYWTDITAVGDNVATIYDRDWP